MISGYPAISQNCLGVLRPVRSPVPAAGRIAKTFFFSESRSIASFIVGVLLLALAS